MDEEKTDEMSMGKLQNMYSTSLAKLTDFINLCRD